MNHYCTLFDSSYLSRGLAMYRSLIDVGEEFTLYIVCFNDLAYKTLEKMNLPGVVTVPLEEFESEELKIVKPQRSRAEYCWTCTPHVIRYVLDTFRLSAVTYLDADLFFYARPSILLDEMEQSGKSVLITEHRYSRKYEHLIDAGIYCVQFLCFKADRNGMRVLEWWQERCLEWCYDRLEEGRFGDQKYLDGWPERFEGIHVLQHPGGGIAPWNIQRYRIFMRAGKPHLVERVTAQESAIVFYHFHAIRFYNNGDMELGHYSLKREVKKLLYRPYLEKLEENKCEVTRFDSSFDPNGPVPPPKGFVKMLGRLQRRIKGNLFLYKKYRSL